MNRNRLVPTLASILVSLLAGCVTDLEQEEELADDLGDDSQEATAPPVCDTSKLKATGIIANNVGGRITEIRYQVDNQGPECHVSGTLKSLTPFPATYSIPDRVFARGLKLYPHAIPDGGKVRPVTLKVCPTTVVNNNVCVTKAFQ